MPNIRLMLIESEDLEEEAIGKEGEVKASLNES